MSTTAATATATEGTSFWTEGKQGTTGKGLKGQIQIQILTGLLGWGLRLIEFCILYFYLSGTHILKAHSGEGGLLNRPLGR